MNPTTSILVTGDLVPLHRAGELLAAGDFETVFGDFLPEIRRSGLAVTNLETAVTEGGEPIVKFGPNLKVPPAVLPALTRAGFQVYALANNHSRDWGDEAFLETMRHVTDTGAQYVGGGKDLEDAMRPCRVTVDGLRITIINATMHQPCCAAGGHPGATPLVPARIAAQIAAEKNQCDFLLAIIHDGKEHNPFPSARIRENYRAFADAGADAVIGHHPHIAQGYEVYHNSFIAYSLGNFLFPPRIKEKVKGFWFRSYSVRLHIAEHRVVKFDILPHTVDRDSDCLSLMQGQPKQDFLADLEKLCNILKSDAETDRYYTGLARRALKNYLKRITEDPAYFAHAMETEEHSDMIRTALVSKASDPDYSEPEDLDHFLQNK